MQTLPDMDLSHSLAGLLVGFMVGMTGVGGGSLMAPLLILLFGFSPRTAIGTDLWFAAVTKMVGGSIHHRLGSPDWKVFGLLAAGSVPAAVLTLIWMGTHWGEKLDSDLLLRFLGGALILSAIAAPLKDRMRQVIARHRQDHGAGISRGQAIGTICGGAAVGVLVSLTSVGAGAIVAVLLMIIYPLRLSTKSLVGTDIIHAVPLALVAAIGHSFMGNVDWTLLVALLIGSIPGVFLGSLAADRMNDTVIRFALAAMLMISGIKLLTT